MRKNVWNMFKMLWNFFFAYVSSMRYKRMRNLEHMDRRKRTHGEPIMHFTIWDENNVS